MLRVPPWVARAFWSHYGRHAWDSVHRGGLVDEVVAALERHGAQRGGIVLDAGCGTGEVAIACARRGYRVVAADFAPGMIEGATRRVAEAPGLPVVVQVADLGRAWPWPAASFDHALAISVLQALPDPAAALGELARVVRQGGLLVIVHRRRPPDSARTAPGPQRSLWRVAKVLGDRVGTRYWLPPTLAAMLSTAGFEVLTDAGDDLAVIVARRTGG